MARQQIAFEWQIGDATEREWIIPPLEPELFSQTTEHLLTSGERRLTAWMLRVSAGMVVLFLATAGAGLSTLERDRQIAYSGVQSNLLREDLAWETRDRKTFDSLIDAETVGDEWVRAWRETWRLELDEAPRYEVELLHIEPLDGQDLVQAQVRLRQPDVEWWRAKHLQEARFYRSTESGWLRTLPPDSYWGEHLTYETDHLRFVYRERDRAAVEAIMHEIDAAYVALYELLSVSLDADKPKLTVNIEPGLVRRLVTGENQIDVMSPVLEKITDGQSTADYLAESIMGRMTYQAIRDAYPSSSGRYLYRWPIMIWGVRGWLRTELLGRTSPWRAEAVEIFYDRSLDNYPLPLTLATDLRGDQQPTRSQVLWRYIAAESIIEYVALTYGRERVPDLLNGLVKYGSWSDLVPNVFGESVEEFELGWNLYLAEAYEISDIELLTTTQ